MFVVLVMSYAPNGDLFNKLERAHKEQRHLPEETIRVSVVSACSRPSICWFRTSSIQAPEEMTSQSLSLSISAQRLFCTPA